MVSTKHGMKMTKDRHMRIWTNLKIKTRIDPPNAAVFKTTLLPYLMPAVYRLV